MNTSINTYVYIYIHVLTNVQTLTYVSTELSRCVSSRFRNTHMWHHEDHTRPLEDLLRETSRKSIVCTFVTICRTRSVGGTAVLCTHVLDRRSDAWRGNVWPLPPRGDDSSGTGWRQTLTASRTSENEQRDVVHMTCTRLAVYSRVFRYVHIRIDTDEYLYLHKTIQNNGVWCNV